MGTENPIQGNDRVADPNRVTIPPHVRGGDFCAVGFPNAVQVASPSRGRSSRASTSGEHPQPDRAELREEEIDNRVHAGDANQARPERPGFLRRMRLLGGTGALRAGFNLSARRGFQAKRPRGSPPSGSRGIAGLRTVRRNLPNSSGCPLMAISGHSTAQ